MLPISYDPEIAKTICSWCGVVEKFQIRRLGNLVVGQAVSLISCESISKSLWASVSVFEK